VTIETRRLTLQPVGDGDDPADFLPVFNTNPDFIEASEQFTGKDAYDLSDVERYLWQETRRDSSRCLAIRQREDGHLIGTTCLLVPNPRDDVPWIGLLILMKDAQGRGMGTEIASAIEEHLAKESWSELRLSVLRSRPRDRAWWEHRGYAVIDERPDQDKRPTWVMSKSLA
jgi:RimJ/RimL family protein N-acetyltransferase